MAAFLEVLGVVLAGGQSSRMGRDKADLQIGHATLLQLAVENFRVNQLDVVISSNTTSHDIGDTNIKFIADDEHHRYSGPLAGIAAALQYAQYRNYAFIVTIPVDSPIIPDDYFQRMLKNIGEQQPIRLAETPVGLQPAFALWPVYLLPELQAFMASSQKKSIRAFAFGQKAETISFDNPYPKGAFFNINTLQDLEFAKREIFGKE
ncbi:molybdenum cofactor guanylyltransferase [Bartonella sp. LJL80]